MAFGINLGQLGAQFNQARTNVGQAVANVSHAAGIPHIGVSDAIAGHPVTAQTGNTYAATSSLPNFSGTTGSVVNGTYIAPSTSGGSVLGASTGGSGGYGGTLNLIAPVGGNTATSDQNSLDLLNQQYDQAANDISGQAAPLDASYNQSKGDIGNAITSAQGKADSQKTANDKTYGDVLKQAVQTYNELKQREQGTFSALGTLDSSAYQDATQKADQGISDQTNSIDTNKANSNNAIDSQLNDYTNQANSQLAQLGIQYQQGKIAIASAMAHNRLDQAQAIQDAISQIRSNAQAIANNMINFQNQAQLLKAQGLNVQTNIAGQDATPFAQQTGQQLTNTANQGALTYQVPTATTPQYLGAQTKSKIDPITGLPIATA